jgi:hypothetical protein
MPAAFQDMQEAGDVTADTNVWVLRRVPYDRLDGQVRGPLRLVDGERRFHRRTIGQVGFDVGVVRVGHEAFQTGLLQVHIAVVAHVVEADHLITALNQPHHEMRANESGGTRHRIFLFHALMSMAVDWGGIGCRRRCPQTNV